MIARPVPSRPAELGSDGTRAGGLGVAWPRIDAVAGVVVVACAAAIGMCAYYGVRTTTWAVMTDELQVVRLAMSVAETLSTVPTLRGEYYAAHSQLYPVLLAPLYGALGPPEAAAAAHVVNALLLVGAAVPAFLLARSVTGSITAGWVAAALTALTPWLVLSATLLTENAAYPAFAWAVLLCHRTLARPSPGRDAAALAGLALAFFARTQLLVLALALPVAVVLLALREHGLTRAALIETVGRHRVLAAAYCAGALGAGALAAAGSLAGVVGNYALPFEGDLVPAGFARAALEHAVQVTLGVGILPVVLTLSWLVTAMLGPARVEERAFAALALVVVPLILAQVTSFDLRFTPGGFIQDRYLVYLVPFFAVGCVAWLTGPGPRRLRLVTALVAGALVVAAIRFAPIEETVIFWAAPAAAFRPAVASAGASIGVSDLTLLQVAAAAFVLAAVGAAWRVPSRVLVGVGLAMALLGAGQAVYVFERFAEPALVHDDVAPRDWIDRALPRGSAVTLVPGGSVGPGPWWDAELWNRSVVRELRVDGGLVHTPFPVLDATTDPRRRTLAGPQPSEHLVLAQDEKRFGLVEEAELAARPPLRLVRVPRPYRLEWVTRGLRPDGWMRTARPASVRLLGSDRTEQRALRITLAASAQSPRPVPFVVRGPGIEIRDAVGPGAARPPLEVTACVPANGSVEIRLVGREGIRLDDGSSVSLHVERIELSEPWPCTAS